MLDTLIFTLLRNYYFQIKKQLFLYPTLLLAGFHLTQHCRDEINGETVIFHRPQCLSRDQSDHFNAKQLASIKALPGTGLRQKILQDKLVFQTFITLYLILSVNLVILQYLFDFALFKRTSHILLCSSDGIFQVLGELQGVEVEGEGPFLPVVLVGGILDDKVRTVDRWVLSDKLHILVRLSQQQNGLRYFLIQNQIFVHPRERRILHFETISQQLIVHLGEEEALRLDDGAPPRGDLIDIVGEEEGAAHEQPARINLLQRLQVKLLQDGFSCAYFNLESSEGEEVSGQDGYEQRYFKHYIIEYINDTGVVNRWGRWFGLIEYNI